MKKAPGLPMTPGDERLAQVNPHAMDVMKLPEGQKMVSDIRSTVRESMDIDYMRALHSLLGGKEIVEGESSRGRVSIARLADGAIAVISNNGIAVEEFVIQDGASPFGMRYSSQQGVDGEGTTVSADGLSSIIRSFKSRASKVAM